MTMRNIKRHWQILLVGIVTSIFGVLMHKNMTGISSNMSRLNGMIQGAGFALVVIGGFSLFQTKRISSEKLKAKEIELKDERNIELMRMSLSISSSVATIIFVVMAFLFVGLDYIVPAFISIGAMYIQILAFFIANKYYEKKM